MPTVPSILVAALATALLVQPAAAQSSPMHADGPAPAIVRAGVAVPSAAAVPDTRPVAAADGASGARPGPTADRAVAGIRVDAAVGASDAQAPAATRVGRNPAMMIVGGAALIVGAVIGGDAGTIVMVGGAVVGLVGLWNYLR